MSRLRYSIAAFAVLPALVFGSSGEAQTAGTYTGTTADGSPIAFTVATDGNGNLAVTAATQTFNAKCNGTAPSTLPTTWGFFFGSEIKNQRAKFTYGVGGGSSIYDAITFDFATSPVSGTTSSRIAILATGKDAPGRAEYCVSARQAYTATLSSSTPAAPALQPGAAVVLPSNP
jgi:hypothetical protein